MTDTLTTRSTFLDALTDYNPLAVSSWERGRFNKRDDQSGFNSWSQLHYSDDDAVRLVRYANALDVLHDAYKLNEDTVKLARPIVTPADPFAHIDAMIHEEFPGAIPDAKLGKLRALAQERLDLKAQLAEAVEYGKVIDAELTRVRNEPITDGKDPRIDGLMRRAAEVATAEEYCEVYDNIASQVGFPTRSDLGMGKHDYSVTITRIMSLTPSEVSNLDVQDVTSNRWACSLDYEVVEED